MFYRNRVSTTTCTC